MRAPRFRTAIAVAAVAALALTACAESERDDTPEQDDGQLVVGTAGEALALDPTWASDGETFRVARQIYDTLVMLEPGSTNIVPGLAETYEADEAGTTWTFNLRQGVTFHDGTPFNAEAVCYNFDRWYNQTGLGQGADVTYYWISIFNGFANNERDGLSESLYTSCTAADEHTAVIELTRVSSKFPAALVLPAFAIHSPTALQEHDADNLGGTEEDITYPPYALDNATGTGPFKFEPGSWDRSNQTIRLVRNDEYWGGAPTISELIFRAIPDENARRQALISGDIDGYDLPSAADFDSLRSEGMDLHIRDTLTLLYLAFTQSANPELEKLEVRQAIAHALNRQAMVDARLPEGGEVASQFQPPALPGWNADVPQYDYDPDRARELLAEADAEDLSVTFYYPTDVTRPYMPDPQAIAELFIADLEAVGITVEQVALPWTPDYLNAVLNGEADLHLLGWTADYPDAYNFIGTWFAREDPQWGYSFPELWQRMAEADAITDLEERYAVYEELNNMIMEFLPGVPISHSPSAIVFGPHVSGIEVSPLADERFNTAEVSE